MTRYMIQVSYSTQGLSELVKHPQDRGEVIRPVIERMGGKLESFYFTLGDYDLVAILEMPDNVAMTALSLSIGASGAVNSFKTTALMPMSEAVEAMRKAGASGYRPPGG